MILGSRDGAVVRSLASHQCVPGSIPGHSVMRVEFVVGSRPCSVRIFSGYSGFPPSTKTNISKLQFDLETVDEQPLVSKPLCGCATENSHLFYFGTCLVMLYHPTHQKCLRDLFLKEEM